MSREAYNHAACALRDRIASLIPDHPEILEMDDPFGLFKIDGFSVDDISPSLAQAQWALASAKQTHRSKIK